jgi:Cu-Zn family superoxide dismutase
MITKLIPALAISLGASLNSFAQDNHSPAQQLDQAKVAAGIAAQQGLAQRQEQANSLQDLSELVAVIRPLGNQKISGTVRFQKIPGGVKVIANIEGLDANSTHGFHIHEFGDISGQGAMSAGEHFNPDNQPHGMPDNPKKHAGDLGNLTANSDGKATAELTVKNISLAGKNPILGRALIVHAKEDDGTQPSGNAGERIAAGIVGISMANAQAAKAPERRDQERTPVLAPAPTDYKPEE